MTFLSAEQIQKTHIYFPPLRKKHLRWARDNPDNDAAFAKHLEEVN